MIGVDSTLVIKRPGNNLSLFFIVIVTKNWKEAVKVITQTEEPKHKSKLCSTKFNLHIKYFQLLLKVYEWLVIYLLERQEADF